MRKYRTRRRRKNFSIEKMISDSSNTFNEYMENVEDFEEESDFQSFNRLYFLKQAYKYLDQEIFFRMEKIMKDHC